MKNKMTRRELAGAILATTASAATAQVPPTAPSGPAAELQAARDQNQRNAEALVKVPVPVDTEPAFHFTS